MLATAMGLANTNIKPNQGGGTGRRFSNTVVGRNAHQNC